MRTSGIRNFETTVVTSTTPCVIYWNRGLQLKARTVGKSFKFVTTLKETREYGHPPDILTYNSAMELFGNHDLEDEAWALIDDLKGLGVSPDIERSSSYYRCVRHIPSPWDVSKILISTHRLSVTPFVKRLGQCLK